MERLADRHATLDADGLDGIVGFLLQQFSGILHAQVVDIVVERLLAICREQVIDFGNARAQLVCHVGAFQFGSHKEAVVYHRLLHPQKLLVARLIPAIGCFLHCCLSFSGILVLVEIVNKQLLVCQQVFHEATGGFVLGFQLFVGAKRPEHKEQAHRH